MRKLERYYRSLNIRSPSKTVINEAFFLEEYKALRREIEIHLLERGRIEAQVYIGVFATLAWLAVNGNKLTGIYERLGFGLPMAIVLVGLLRCWAVHARTLMIGKYVQRIESNLLLRGVEGWEGWLAKQRANEPLLRNPQGSAEFIGLAMLFILCGAIYYLRFNIN